MTSPHSVRQSLLTRREIALLDVREEADFADAHPLFAANLPLSRLELDAFDRLPRLSVPIVVYDNGEGLAALARDRLQRLGYTDVTLLDGGLAGWRDAGFELFRDVNSYSKAFGELVEARRHTPSLPPEEVRTRIDRGDDLVILDARREDEYRTMSIPGGVSVPGAELALRAPLLAPDPTTTIIVNCAGRTRSLIGAQSLVNAGLPNPIFALRNGTIGWTLAGLDLDRGAGQIAPDPDDAALASGRARARSVAYCAGVRWLDVDTAAGLGDDPARTTYRFDVRTPAEHAAGHPPAYRSAPGGQLVQETDAFAPVRGARILLHDDLGPRADMTAAWLAQMGWDVYVVEGLANSATGIEPPRRPAAPTVPGIGIEALAAGATIVDLATSQRYRRGHIPGARFGIRSRLARDAAGIDPSQLVFTAPDPALAAWAAADFAGARVLTGAWPGTLETGDGTPISPFADVYRRPYEGTDNPREAMQAYLDWEYGLVAQLERDASHGFFVI